MSNTAAEQTIPQRLFNQAKSQPTAPAYFEKVSGAWKSTSWEDYAGLVKSTGKSLMALGLESGQSVCILGFNRPEWVIFDVAAMSIGSAPAGIYTTCSSEEVQYIVEHAEAPIVLVENRAQWEKIEAQKEQLPGLKHVVTMQGAETIDDELVMTWDDFLAKGSETSDEDFFARLNALEPDGLATLIYTSGTTGPPKGVMLSNRNLSWTANVAKELVGAEDDDVALSYLPLSHIAEQMFSIHAAITSGYSIYFAESIDAVPENLKEVRPTVFFGVPRIWEKFHSGVGGKLKLAAGVKKKLVDFAMGGGKEISQVRQDGRQPGWLLAKKYALADKLIYSKLKGAIGLDRARICVSGAAPISQEILEFFAQLDIYVMEVYGQSEDTGPTSFNYAERFRFGSVGPAIKGVKVKIADDGEILVNGPNVFMGYYKNEAATNDALRSLNSATVSTYRESADGHDKWLFSGDLGEFDSDGFLHITGRKKDIIITAGGKNIAPKNLENGLKNHPLINEAVMIGDRRKFLSCLITLDPDAGAAWAEKHGLSTEDLHSSPEIEAEVQACLDKLNPSYAPVEQIKKFTILSRNLTVEDGELTPTLKVKRNKVSEHFADEIEAMYA